VRALGNDGGRAGPGGAAGRRGHAIEGRTVERGVTDGLSGGVDPRYAPPAGEPSIEEPLTGPPLLQLLDALPDATVVVDADGQVTAANDLAARLFARRRDDLVGRPVDEVLRLTDEARADWWACTRPLDGDHTLGLRLVERDLVLRTAQGRDRPVSVTARRIPGEHGIRYVVVSLRHVAARRRVDAARSDLVSTVSHELRAPLTSVKGFTKTLLAKWERFSDEQKRQMLETVNEDADRVTRLLGELLDVSRIDAGRLRLSRRMIDVAPVAHQVVDRFSVRNPERHYDVAVTDGLPRIYADPDKLAQVLTNLCENATNYGRGTVTVAAHADDTVLQLTVADEGGGLDPANLSHLFTKFFRRSGERNAGTGLGLYISRGIVEAHGGRMWAETEPGAKTVFAFTLPLGGLELAGITEETRRVLTEGPKARRERP
jgi:PAS domain S-box-containing protein